MDARRLFDKLRALRRWVGNLGLSQSYGRGKALLRAKENWQVTVDLPTRLIATRLGIDAALARARRD